MKGPFPTTCPFGAIGKTGSPEAYLIDPGAGSASDRVTRHWPDKATLEDIARRGGEITPLYSLDALGKQRDAHADAALPLAFHYERLNFSLMMGLESHPVGRSLIYVLADIAKREALYGRKHPDITGHVADTVRDACIASLGQIITFEESREIAAEIIETISTKSKAITSKGEHWSIEQLKRIIITAMVENQKGAGMSVEARRAADDILELLVPTEQHRRMPEPCTCLSDMADDAYEPGGPMSGKKRPPPCRVHTPEPKRLLDVLAADTPTFKEERIARHRRHSTGPAARLTPFE